MSTVRSVKGCAHSKAKDCFNDFFSSRWLSCLATIVYRNSLVSFVGRQMIILRLSFFFSFKKSLTCPCLCISRTHGGIGNRVLGMEKRKLHPNWGIQICTDFAESSHNDMAKMALKVVGTESGSRQRCRKTELMEREPCQRGEVGNVLNNQKTNKTPRYLVVLYRIFFFFWRCLHSLLYLEQCVTFVFQAYQGQ